MPCAFFEAGFLTDARLTKAPGHAAELARTLGKDYDVVACCGGDGTLNETVCGLMAIDGPQPRLGYLPRRYYQRFCRQPPPAQGQRCCGPRHHQRHPHAHRRGAVQRALFVYVASLRRLYPNVLHVSPAARKTRWATRPICWKLLRQLPSINRSVTLSITADGEDLSGEYLFGSVSNSTSIGGLMKLSPDQVQLDDGKYELLLVKNPKNPLEIQALATALLTQNYGHTGIVYRHVSHVECIPQGELPWTLDGEYAPSAAQVMIDNLHQAVTLMA